jgi:uncharacterized membrane protein
MFYKYKYKGYKIMTIKSKVVKSAGIGILAMGSVLLSQQASAVPSSPQAWEKCGGVASAGKNDCGSFDGKHKCAGYSTVSNSDAEWVYVPQGTCSKITGGKVLATLPTK